MFWLSGAKWLGTVCGVAGAIMIALNLGVVAYGFALFLVSSLLWGTVALIQREPSLVVLQSVFTVVDVLGLWRWAA
jgi:nicotinamide riboside transporter PnuC